MVWHNMTSVVMFVWWYCILQDGLLWYGMAWHGMAWHGMVWYGMVWYGMVWYGMVWCVIWYMVWCDVSCCGMVSHVLFSKLKS